MDVLETYLREGEMPKILYVDKKFSASSYEIIDRANKILGDYAAQGYVITLRQLYYQFVSRDLLPNTVQSYKRLGSIINDARLAGLVDWAYMEDRTRNLEQNPHWDSPADIIDACARQFRFDLWEGQQYRPEVWIEKDALVGIIEGVCEDNDVPYFSCRGYTSQSEMWGAARRMIDFNSNDQMPFIIHLGDHDPSGIDMSRDIQDRLEIFTADIKFERIALNMDQVKTFNPPPNPAKITDSRARGYIAEFGSDSWELDALEPAELVRLITAAVEGIRDEDLWEQAVKRQAGARRTLKTLSQRWDDISSTLERGE
jgi:hypothetical protein